MQLNTIKTDNYKFFSRQSPENRTRHIDALKYVEQLAQSSGTPIGFWDIKEIFGSNDGERFFITDRNEINKRFFQAKEKLASGSDAEIASVASIINESLQKTFDAIAKDERDAVLQDIKKGEEIIESRNREIAALTRANWHRQLKLHSLSGTRPPILDLVSNIVKAGFWKVVSATDVRIIFETKNEVIISFIKKTANIDITIDLGFFQAELNIRDMFCAVTPARDNRMTDGFSHPHVDRDGGLCWGNAGHVAHKLLSNGEIDKYMSLLATLLSSYSDQSPYRAIQHFVRRPKVTKQRVHPDLLNIIQKAREASVSRNASDALKLEAMVRESSAEIQNFITPYSGLTLIDLLNNGGLNWQLVEKVSKIKESFVPHLPDLPEPSAPVQMELEDSEEAFPTWEELDQDEDEENEDDY